MNPSLVSKERWEATDSERRQAEETASEPLTPAVVARILLRSPRVLPDALRLAASAAYTGMWSSSGLRALLNSERAAQRIPHRARGAALWAPEEPFVGTLTGVLGPTARALEIGCGSGRISRHAAPLVGRLHCGDVSETMLRDCRQALADFKNVEYVLLDGRSLEGLPDSDLDAVFAHAVFYHFDLVQCLGMLDEINRVLAPGGLCVLSFRTIDDPRGASDAMEDSRRVRARGLGSGRALPYAAAQIVSLYELAGLSLVSTTSSDLGSIGSYTVFIGRKA